VTVRVKSKGMLGVLVVDAVEVVDVCEVRMIVVVEAVVVLEVEGTDELV